MTCRDRSWSVPTSTNRTTPASVARAMTSSPRWPGGRWQWLSIQRIASGATSGVESLIVFAQFDLGEEGLGRSDGRARGDLVATPARRRSEDLVQGSRRERQE